MNMIDQTLARSSRMLALAGVAGIAFGVIVLVWPNISLSAFLALFGALALVSGAFTLAAGLELLAERSTHWVPLVVGGLAGIAIGAVTFLWPHVTGLMLLYFIAAWAIVTGILEIIAAIQLRQEIDNEWMLGLGGVLSIVFGAILVFQPQAGALALIWVIGAYAIVFGAALIGLGFKLRSVGEHLPFSSRAPAQA